MSRAISRASSFFLPCTKGPKATESRIGMRGLSEEYESWNTICTWRRNAPTAIPSGTPTASPSKISSPASGITRCSSSRARVDLPQPDSPTIPKVSPLSTVNETPSTACTDLPPLPFTGKCLRKSRAISIGCCRPPRSRGSRARLSGIGKSNPLHPHVHCRSQPVADQIGADRGDEDRQTRQPADQRHDIDRLAQGAEHQPPIRHRRAHAEAEEREPGRQQDADADQRGGVDEHRPQHIAEDVVADDGGR